MNFSILKEVESLLLPPPQATGYANGYAKIRKFFDAVLDRAPQTNAGQNGAEKAQLVDAGFNRRDDIESVAQIAMRPKPDFGRTLFNQLAPFFDAGFCLRELDKSRQMKIESVFLFGRLYPDINGHRVEMSLPMRATASAKDALSTGVSAPCVLRGRASAVFKSLGLDLPTLSQADAFAFAPVSEHVYILVSDRPPLWQGDFTERTFAVLTSIAEQVCAQMPIENRGR